MTGLAAVLSAVAALLGAGPDAAAADASCRGLVRHAPPRMASAFDVPPALPAQASPQAAAQPSATRKLDCTVPRELGRFTRPLKRFAAAVASSHDIPIVALGTSSTAGSGTGGPEASYPARLDLELDRRFPDKNFIVTNLGTGGQSAREMLERIETTIVPQPPALVLWQTGVNEVVSGTGLEAFRESLDKGLAALEAAGIDVVLIDMQYFPRAERMPGYDDYRRAMRTAAEAAGVPLFSRYAVMRHLLRSGQHTSEQLLAPDNFHLNDLSYGCLADLMADALEEQIRSGRTSTMVPMRR